MKLKQRRKGVKMGKKQEERILKYENKNIMNSRQKKVVKSCNQRNEKKTWKKRENLNNFFVNKISFISKGNWPGNDIMTEAIPVYFLKGKFSTFKLFK